MSRDASGKLKKHVLRQVQDSPILKGHEAAYAKWNDILEGEGLRALDNEYRAAGEHQNARKHKRGPNADLARFEYYEGLRDYCRYNHFKLECMSKLQNPQLQQFSQMLILFSNGMSMPEAYKIVKANYPKIIYTAIYFYKRFQECKNEFLANFNNFNDYMSYRKYELKEPLSFESWMQREGLLKQ
jgi:hypothetical protein